MILNEKQKAQLDEIIEKGQDFEFQRCNKIVGVAVKEWQDKVKTDKEAYDKIYKKVIKNEHYLALRYSNIDDDRRIQIVAELYVENIIDHDLFDALDEELRNAVFSLTRIKK